MVPGRDVRMRGWRAFLLQDGGSPNQWPRCAPLETTSAAVGCLTNERHQDPGSRCLRVSSSSAWRRKPRPAAPL